MVIIKKLIGIVIFVCISIQISSQHIEENVNQMDNRKHSINIEIIGRTLVMTSINYEYKIFKKLALGTGFGLISIGRGIGSEENIEMAKELTSLLNGELASSRPVVDSGWLESSRQVGSSGQTVSPKLYFAIGISGAIQHMVGMKSSKNIVAINKDKNAPIFEISDYGIVDDIFEVIPKLIESLKNS